MKVENIEIKDLEALNGGFIRDKSIVKTSRYEIIEGRLFLDGVHSTKATIKIAGRSPGKLIAIEDCEEIKEEFRKIEEKARQRAVQRNMVRLIYLLTAVIIATFMTVPAIFSRQTGTLTTTRLTQTIVFGLILETILYLIYRRRKNNMKKAVYITTILTGISMGIAVEVGANTIVASAEEVNAEIAPASDPAKTIAEGWYQQLVVEGKNEAVFRFDEFIEVDLLDAYKELLAMDSPDTLFDGESLDLRGTSHFSLNSAGEYKIEIPNGYNVLEADRLTTEWAEEVLRRTGENATDREKMYAICDLVRSIYSYAYEERDAGIHVDFVTKYHGDRKILCGQFSAVTYLIANKLGIDCRIMESQKHAYNIVRLDNENEYTILDLTGNRYGFVDSTERSNNPGLYTMDGVEDEIIIKYRNMVNGTKSAKPAGRFEALRQYLYYLTHGYPINTNLWEIKILKAMAILGIVAAIIASLVIRGTLENVMFRARRRRRKRRVRVALSPA